MSSRNESKEEVSKKDVKCYGCGKKGHIKRDCRSRPKEDSKFGLLGTVKGRENEWVADGGASFHMTSNCSNFSTYENLDFPLEISMANGEPIKAIGKGEIECMVYDGKDWNKSTLHNVYHIPELGEISLFSEGAAIDRGNSVMKFSNRLEIWDKNGKTICTGTREPGELWTLNLKVIPKGQVYSARADNITWHKKLGHTSIGKLDLIIRKESAEGLETTKTQTEIKCPECPLGRMISLPCKTVGTTEEAVGEHLSADICGPMKDDSLGGARYFLLIKDRISCYREVYFLKTKEAEEVCSHLEKHIRMSKTQTEMRVKTLRTDNGTEFVNLEMSKLLSKLGIKHQRTTPYTPEQNGSVERDSKTIVEMPEPCCKTTTRTLGRAGKHGSVSAQQDSKSKGRHLTVWKTFWEKTQS
jgi:hypothetical protein